MNDKFSQKPATTIDFPANKRDKETAFAAVGENNGEIPMCVFHYKNGKSRAIPYGKIEFVDFDPSGKIDILLNGRKNHIIIKGRNLKKIHTSIASHKAKWIKEEDALHDNPNEDKAFVSAIEWVETEDD